MNQCYDLEERLLEYAARIIRLVEKLPNNRAGNHVAGQLLRAGTSPLPNHGEAQAAESRKDFVHKLKICHKELRESRRWLRLIQRVPLLKPALVERLLQETEELIRIFQTSIRTANKGNGSVQRLAFKVQNWALDVESLIRLFYGVSAGEQDGHTQLVGG